MRAGKTFDIFAGCVLAPPENNERQTGRATSGGRGRGTGHTPVMRLEDRARGLSHCVVTERWLPFSASPIPSYFWASESVLL